MQMQTPDILWWLKIHQMEELHMMFYKLAPIKVSEEPFGGPR